MNDFESCLKKSGVEILEPNLNLAIGYMSKAEEALDERKNVKSRAWKIEISYYSMYFSLYSVLQKIGVKCEIHTCTISFMKTFLSKHFTNEDMHLIELARKARVDEQYYTNRQINTAHFEEIYNNAPAFVSNCRNINLTDKEIEQIRAKLKEEKQRILSKK